MNKATKARQGSGSKVTITTAVMVGSVVMDAVSRVRLCVVRVTKDTSVAGGDEEVSWR